MAAVALHYTEQGIEATSTRMLVNKGFSTRHQRDSIGSGSSAASVSKPFRRIQIEMDATAESANEASAAEHWAVSFFCGGSLTTFLEVTDSEQWLQTQIFPNTGQHQF